MKSIVNKMNVPLSSLTPLMSLELHFTRKLKVWLLEKNCFGKNAVTFHRVNPSVAGMISSANYWVRASLVSIGDLNRVTHLRSDPSQCFSMKTLANEDAFTAV